MRRTQPLVRHLCLAALLGTLVLMFPSTTFAQADADVTADDLQKIAAAMQEKRDELVSIASNTENWDRPFQLGDLWTDEELSKSEEAKALHDVEEVYRNTVLAGLVFRTRNIDLRKTAAAALKPMLIEALRDLNFILQNADAQYEIEHDRLVAATDHLEILGSNYAYGIQADRAKRVSRARVAGLMKAAYIRLSTVNSYFSSNAGLVKPGELTELDKIPPPLFKMDREVNWITFYLAQLVDRLIIISSELPDNDITPIQTFLHDQEREILFEEIVRLAQTATLINGETGGTFTAHQRTQVGASILKNIADYIAIKPLAFPLDGDRLDDLAARIRAHVETPGARIATFLEGADDPTPRAFFFAAKHALAVQGMMAIDQFRTQYVGADQTALDTGLGTLLRANNVDLSWSGGEGLAEVKSRLAKFEAEATHVSMMFDMAARTDDPGDLDRNVRDQLMKFGLVVAYKDPKTDEIDYAYNVINATAPIGDFINRAEAEIKLPGDSLLNLINAKSVAITIAATYIPALGTRWILSGLSTATRAQHLFGKILIETGSELVSGISLDLAQNYAENKGFTANYERALIESLIGVPLQGVATEFTSDILRSAVRRASNNANSAATFHFFRRALEDNRSHAGQIYKIINESTELLADTAMGFAVQPLIEGAPVDMAAFQAMLLQGAIARSAMRALGSGDAHPDAHLNSLNHPALKKALSNPAFRAEILAKVRERRIIVREKARAYRAVVSDADFDANSHFHSMLTGEFDFAATKQLYKDRQMPGGMIDKVGELRVIKIEQDAHDARPVATRRVYAAFEQFLELEMRHNGGDRAAAYEAAHKRVQWELDRINQPLIIPGADTAISDKDRSTHSTFLRRALVEVGELNARLETGDNVVTLGESIDTNEYYNGLPLIYESAQYQERMRGLGVTEPGFGEWNHGEASHAIALSGPLSEAEPGSLVNYFKTRKEKFRQELEANNVPAGRIDSEMIQFDRKVAWARDHVERTRADLVRRTKEHMAEAEISKETAKYKAMEDLYHERLKEISDEVWRLHQLNDQYGSDSMEALTVRAKVMRLLAIANRDGINTYSAGVTIDLVVGKTQIPVEVTAADGTVSKEKLGVRQRIADSNFTNKPGGALAHYSDKDIQAAIRDQDADLIKHFNLYRMGKLSEVDLARAVAKYVERIYYFRSILGTDIAAIEARPDTDPEKRLWLAAKKIVDKKGDPAAMGKIVTDLSRKALPSEVSGTAELLYLLERSFPRFRGLTGVVPGLKGSTVAPSLHVKGGEDFAGVAFSLLAEALAKDLFRIETTRKVAGEKALVDFLTNTLKGIDREEAHLLARQKELLALTRKYRMRNWDRIRDFGREMDFWGGMHDTLIYWATVGPEQRATFTATRVLDNYTTAKRTYDRLLATETPGDPDAILMADAKAGGYHRLKARLAALKERRTRLTEEREKARKAAEIQEKFRGLDMSGSWVCDDLTGEVREIVITHDVNGMAQDFTADLYREVLSHDEPWIRMKGKYLLGRLYGVWWSETDFSEPPEPGIPALRAARHFDAKVNDANTKLRITRGQAHPDIAIDWHNMTCTRLDAPVDSNEAAITVTYKPEPDDSPYEPNWSFNTGGAAMFIRRGRKIYFDPRTDAPNFRLDPGTYTTTATAGGVSVSRTFDIKQGFIAEIGFPTAALRLVGVPDSDKMSLELRLYQAGDRSTDLATFRPGDFAPVMPGIYDLELATQMNGSTWLSNIELEPDQKLDVHTRTGTLIVSGGEGLKVRVGRIVADGAGEPFWLAQPGNGRYGAIQPGLYDISWEEEGTTRSLKVKIGPGEERQVRLQ